MTEQEAEQIYKEGQQVCSALKEAFNEHAPEVGHAGGELGVRWFVISFLLAHMAYAKEHLGRPEEGEMVVHTFIQDVIQAVQGFDLDSYLDS